MRVPLRLQPRTAAGLTIERIGEPVTFGVPLPRGAARGDASWRLVTSNGNSTPAQTRVLDRWPDGTTRWMLVDACVDYRPGHANECALETVDASAGADTANRVNATAKGNAARFDMGGIDVECPAEASTMFRAIADRDPSRPISGSVAITDAGGVERSCVLTSVTVTEEGPLRAAATMAGGVPLESGATLDLTARLDAYASSPVVRLRLTMTNPRAAIHPGGFWDLGDAGSVLVRDVSFILATGQAAGDLLLVLEPGAAPVPAQAPVELYQDSSGGENWRSTNHVNRERRVPTTFRGYRCQSGGQVIEGLRATPVVAAGGAAIAVPEFWQNFPQAIEADAGGLRWRLLPRQFADVHELQGGEQKTWECYLALGPDRITAVPLAWCQSRLVAAADPAWIEASNAVPFLAPLEPGHAMLVSAAVDGRDAFERKREVIDEFGWRHFGEIYGDHEAVRQKDPPLVSHYNNQYDPVAGFGLQFLRTGDVRWWAMADELARHVIDIDVYHTARDKWAYNHGLFWHTYHYGDADTATHRTYPARAKGATHGGGPSADHNYTTGLALHYLLTGDEASRRTVIDLAQYVITLDDGRNTVFRWLDGGPTGLATLSAGYYGPGRGPANSVNALLDGYRLSGDARFLSKAEALIRRVVHPAEDISRHRLDDPEERWFYLMFLQSLGKYLHLKAEQGQLDAAYAYGRDCLLHYARWMAAHEYPYLQKPEKLVFPTETWAAQDIRKSDVFSCAAMHADGDERALFEERSRFFHRHSVESLRAMPTRALARPVVVLLTSGFVEAWRARHPDAVEPPPAVRVAHGPPQVFVPQRLRAERRARWLAAGLLTAGLLGVMALLR